ncbi:MAG: 50S ribosomal protein L22 [Mycoplasmataceae bacterium]|jgi:ribosomal protein L22|nr:50S ribosomal protein L22 [Mycoplasmataceae bacterium]
MITYAKQKGISISPRKLGLICDLIRGKKVIEAKRILMVLDKKGAKIVLKILISAVANASHNLSLDINKLYVLNAIADQGITIKRTLPKAKGSASVLKKRHSHLTITVSDDASDKLNQHKKISGKSKKPVIAKNNKNKKNFVNPSKKQKNNIIDNELPNIAVDENQMPVIEDENPIDQVSLKDEIKIASIIEEKEEKNK